MVIPQFSIRQLLAITTVCGVFFLIVSLALRGVIWATAVSMAGFGLLVCFALYGLCFFAVWSMSRFVARFSSPKTARSPFAHDTMPPQIVAPDEPE